LINQSTCLPPPLQAPLKPEPTNPEPTSPPALATATAGASSSSNLLGTVQEAINGRSAMLGFAAAAVSETVSHRSVWSQVVDAPDGNAALAYFAAVLLITMASLFPKLMDDLNVDSKSFGPFTPGLESLLGRIAMLGFSGLIVVEAVKQSPLL
jgi:hypothetical protein